MDVEIQSVVESLDAVPEVLRGFYSRSEDGKFKLEDINGLRANRDRTLSEKKRIADKIAKAKERGFDIDRLLSLELDEPVDIEELLQLRAQKAAAKDEGGEKAIPADVRAKWDAEKARELAKRQADIDAWKAKAEAAYTALRDRDLRDLVRRAAGEAGIDPTKLEDALALTRNLHQLEDDGTVTILDEAGDPTSITLDKFWKEHLRERRPWLYIGTTSSGSGATASNHQRSGGAVVDFSKLSPAERMNAARRRRA